MLKPSIIFLNGPDNTSKQYLLANLRKKFPTSCVVINRKNLLDMFVADKEEKTESYEWLIAKVIKNILNNGVFVLFDGFLPTRRVEQYVSQMHGLPCYWIGIFFKEYNQQLYDFSVKIEDLDERNARLDERDARKRLSAERYQKQYDDEYDQDQDEYDQDEYYESEESNQNEEEVESAEFDENEECANKEFEDVIKEANDIQLEDEDFSKDECELILANENSVIEQNQDNQEKDSQEQSEVFKESAKLSIESAANAIFEYISENSPRYFESMRSVEFVARKREIDTRSLNENSYRNNYMEVEKEPLVFATPEEKRAYKESKFRSLKNKYSRDPNDSSEEMQNNEDGENQSQNTNVSSEGGELKSQDNSRSFRGAYRSFGDRGRERSSYGGRSSYGERSSYGSRDNSRSYGERGNSSRFGNRENGGENRYENRRADNGGYQERRERSYENGPRDRADFAPRREYGSREGQEQGRDFKPRSFERRDSYPQSRFSERKFGQDRGDENRAGDHGENKYDERRES